MQNNISPDKILPPTGGITLTSTGIGGGLLGVVSFIPAEWQKLGFIIVPIISPLLSWFILFLYYKFSEPLPIVSMRALLNRDLKGLRNILNDKYASDELKERAQIEYDDTIFKLANLNKHNSNIGHEITASADNDEN